MTITDKIRKLIKKRKDDGTLVDDNVTTDRQLKSLRRQRRLQNEEIEKQRLKMQIAKFNKERNSQLMFGIGQKSMSTIGKPFTKLEKEKINKGKKFKKEKMNMGSMFGKF